MKTLLTVGFSAMLAASMTGCVPTPPARVDSMRLLGASAQNPDLRKLKVAVVHTENTHNAMRYVAARTSLVDGMGRRITPDDIELMRSVKAAFEALFGSVVIVPSPDDARAQGASLLAILDIYAAFGSGSFSKTTLDIAVNFLTLERQPVATVRGRGEGMIPVPAYSLRWDSSSKAAVDGFSVAMSTNAELAAFAKSAPAASAPSLPAPSGGAPALISDVDEPPRRGAERPDDFALVIGIEEYQNVPRADYGARDAKAVRKHLEAMGFPPRNIISLSGSEATGTKLRSYLEEWLPLNVKPTSTLFVYYSGHGAPDAKTGDAYLVPWDGDPKFLKTTALPLTKLYADLAKTKAKRVIVALDACFSGGGGRSVLAKGARPLIAKIADAAPTGGNLTVLAAASGDEITGSLDEQGHGMFTYHLLKGLSADPKTSAKALFLYVMPRVQDDARRQNRVQTPVLAGASLSEPLLP